MKEVFNKLITIKQQIKEAEAYLADKKEEFENSIIIEKAALSDLLDQEDKLKEEAILQLEKDGLSNIKVDDKTITKAVKYTRRIIDPSQLFNSIIYNKEKIEEFIPDVDIVDYANEELFETVTQIKDKKAIDVILTKYEQINGQNLEGIEIKETKFIMIK